MHYDGLIQCTMRCSTPGPCNGTMQGPGALNEPAALRFLCLQQRLASHESTVKVGCDCGGERVQSPALNSIPAGESPACSRRVCWGQLESHATIDGERVQPKIGPRLPLALVVCHTGDEPGPRVRGQNTVSVKGRMSPNRNGEVRFLLRLNTV